LRAWSCADTRAGGDDEWRAVSKVKDWSMSTFDPLMSSRVISWSISHIVIIVILLITARRRRAMHACMADERVITKL
jgi:hypothetical protein